jgi:hypothetical protein
MLSGDEHKGGDRLKRKRLSGFISQNLSVVLWIILIGLFIGLCAYLSINWEFLTG